MQVCWIQAVGLYLAMALMAIVVILARTQDVSVDLNAAPAAVCALAVTGIVIISGLVAASTLGRSDPAMLLR